MRNAGSVCWCMPGLLVQSSDTHGRVVATLVCLQHLGSRGRFAHAPRIFRERTRGASYCRSFSFSDRPLFVTGNLAGTLRWLPPPALVKSRTALATMNFLLLAQLVSATLPQILNTVQRFFVRWTSTFRTLHCARIPSRDTSKSRDKSPASVSSSDAAVLYDEDLADDDRVAVLPAQVARLQTDQRDQRLAIEGALLQDPYVASD